MPPSPNLRKVLIPLTLESSSALALVSPLSSNWKKEDGHIFLAMYRICRKEEQDLEFEKETKDQERLTKEENRYHHY